VVYHPIDRALRIRIINHQSQRHFLIIDRILDNNKQQRSK
jgi:hypothetical protein